jgi:hypothetical protein
LHNGELTCKSKSHKIWNEENYTAAIDQNYAQVPSFECVEDFEKWAKEMQNPYNVCGDPSYELRKHCNLAHVFGNKPADQSDIVAGDKQGFLKGSLL